MNKVGYVASHVQGVLIELQKWRDSHLYLSFYIVSRIWRGNIFILPASHVLTSCSYLTFKEITNRRSFEDEFIDTLWNIRQMIDIFSRIAVGGTESNYLENNKMIGEQMVPQRMFNKLASLLSHDIRELHMLRVKPSALRSTIVSRHWYLFDGFLPYTREDDRRGFPCQAAGVGISNRWKL